MAEDSTGLRSQFPSWNIPCGVTFILAWHLWLSAVVSLGAGEQCFFCCQKSRGKCHTNANRLTEAAPKLPKFELCSVLKAVLKTCCCPPRQKKKKKKNEILMAMVEIAYFG